MIARGAFWTSAGAGRRARAFVRSPTSEGRRAGGSLGAFVRSPTSEGRRAGGSLGAVAVGVAVAAFVVTLMGASALGAIPNAPNDPYYSSQWALKVIKAPQAWSVSTGAGAVVAVIDTGVQFGIPDLPASKSAGSYDCIGVGASGNPCRADGGGDGQGHGTWVASIIASQTNNGIGIAGVAPDAKILAIRAISPDGTGSVEDISAGIRFAAGQGAKVINLSVGPDAFGKPFPSLECPPSVVGGCLTPPVTDAASLHRALQPAVDYAAARGALVVVAAGNTDPGSGPGPSLYLGMQNLLIVGASGPHDEAAAYSDTGSGPTFIWAPGGNGSCSSGDTSNCIILASMRGGYQVSEGTSFATPHVAGVAALVMANGYSNSAAASRIVSSADQVQVGARLDAAAAVGASSALPAPNPLPAVAPAARPSPPPVVAPVTAKPGQPAARIAPPTASPSPALSLTQSPSPAPSVTASLEPTPKVEAAGLAAKRAASQRGLASRMLGLGGDPSGSVAFVLFLAAAGASGVVWLARRLHI